jgi:hypothetical protein
VRREESQVRVRRVTSRWVWSWAGRRELNGSVAQGWRSWGGLHERRSKRTDGGVFGGRKSRRGRVEAPSSRWK